MSGFLSIQVGDKYGRFMETVLRCERKRRGEPRPAWCDPHGNEGHLAITIGDECVYLELAINDDLREHEHPFNDVRDDAQPIIQASLFA